MLRYYRSVTYVGLSGDMGSAAGSCPRSSIHWFSVVAGASAGDSLQQLSAATEQVTAETRLATQADGECTSRVMPAVAGSASPPNSSPSGGVN